MRFLAAQIEALRWIIFDNQKVNGFLGPFRFLKNFAKPAGDPAVDAWLQRADEVREAALQAPRVMPVDRERSAP